MFSTVYKSSYHLFVTNGLFSYACASYSGDERATDFLVPPLFFKVTLVWLSNAELNVFIDEFTIPFVANVSDAIRISVVFFFSLLLSLFRQL